MVKINKPLFAVTAVLLCWLLQAAHVHGHNRSISTSQWVIDGQQVSMVFSVKIIEVDKLSSIEVVAKESNGPFSDLLRQHLESRLRLTSAAGPCVAESKPKHLMAQKGYVRLEQQFLCPNVEQLTLNNDAFFEVASTHTHFAQVNQGEGQLGEFIFNDRQRSFVINDVDAQGSWHTLTRYTQLGVEHIISGVDHLAFILALMLVCRRLRDVAWLVSGFTLGHGITITLSSLNWLTTQSQIVEALIGFSIALVAIEAGCLRHAQENLAQRMALIVSVVLLMLAMLSWLMAAVMPVMVMLGLMLFSFGYLFLLSNSQLMSYLRPMVTLLFGLLHGFGFGSVLQDIGLPQEQFLLGLLGFNLGVELGQLAVVVFILLLFRCARQFAVKPSQEPVSTIGNGLANLRIGGDALSLVLCAIGLFWFVSRGWVVIPT